MGQLNKATGNPEAFPLLMACIVRAVDLHGDLMRMAIASPGNDFRLGACEAPPAITSTYLGESLTSYLEDAMKTGKFAEYVPQEATVDLGIPSVAPFTVPAEDRNRTSPFPFGGHRFEFRAVGSAQNVSMVNTVLCSIFADSFAEMSKQIEGGKDGKDVAISFLKDHWKCIMNGDNYSEEWPIEAGKRGVWRIDSGVEAMKRISEPKNVALFEGLKVMSKKECDARAECMHDHYSGYVEIEANAMLDMFQQHVIPSVKVRRRTAHLHGSVHAACIAPCVLASPPPMHPLHSAHARLLADLLSLLPCRPRRTSATCCPGSRPPSPPSRRACTACTGRPTPTARPRSRACSASRR